jgi:DNA-binding SARP family transcriptional activator
MSPPGYDEGPPRYEVPLVGRPEAALRVWLLGGFRVSVGFHTIEEGDWHLRKAASLVKLLAVTPGHRLHRERVMDLLWPQLDSRAASNNLRQALHVARQTMQSTPSRASSCLVLQEEQLTLCPGGLLWVDVEAFEEAASTARRERDPAAYRAAIDLYTGDLLPNNLYEEWMEGRRAELRRLHRTIAAGTRGRDAHGPVLRPDPGGSAALQQ